VPQGELIANLILQGLFRGHPSSNPMQVLAFTTMERGCAAPPPR